MNIKTVEFTARAKGMLWWKSIELGNRLKSCTQDEVNAIYMHELGHHVNYHLEKRFLCLLFCPFLLPSLLRKQELEADKYVIEAGLSKGLKSYLQRSTASDTGFHPSKAERLAQIERYE